jgi:outer membrane protein assembly factor BamB
MPATYTPEERDMQNKVMIALTFLCGTVTHAIDTEQITFGGLTEASINECWGGMGVDSRGRIYVGFTGYYGSDREDFGVFRWDPRNGTKEFPGSFRQIAASLDNLPDGNEEMPKGHTTFILRDDVLYMGSQGFHDFKHNLDGLEEQRGGHLFAFDTRTDTWDDISSRRPGGVMVEHDGILALSMTPDRRYIVGLSHPTGKILLYDPETDELAKTFEGIPWRFGYNVARQLITEKPGKIYVSRNHEWPDERDQEAIVREYDIESGEYRELDFGFRGGFLNGKTPTADGSMVYLTTTNGEVYAFDVDAGTFEHLGHFLPRDEYDSGKRIRHIYGHVLSLDEKKLYAIQSWTDNNLYEFDLESGEVVKLASLGPKVYVSYNLRDDEGNIYFAHWDSGEAHLLRIDVSDRTGPKPVGTAPLRVHPGHGPAAHRHRTALVAPALAETPPTLTAAGTMLMLNGRRIHAPLVRPRSVMVLPPPPGRSTAR